MNIIISLFLLLFILSANSQDVMIEDNRIIQLDSSFIHINLISNRPIFEDKEPLIKNRLKETFPELLKIMQKTKGTNTILSNSKNRKKNKTTKHVRF